MVFDVQLPVLVSQRCDSDFGALLGFGQFFLRFG